MDIETEFPTEVCACGGRRARHSRSCDRCLIQVAEDLGILPCGDGVVSRRPVWPLAAAFLVGAVLTYLAWMVVPARALVAW